MKRWNIFISYWSIVYYWVIDECNDIDTSIYRHFELVINISIHLSKYQIKQKSNIDVYRDRDTMKHRCMEMLKHLYIVVLKYCFLSSHRWMQYYRYIDLNIKISVCLSKYQIKQRANIDIYRDMDIMKHWSRCMEIS